MRVEDTAHLRLLFLSAALWQDCVAERRRGQSLDLTLCLYQPRGCSLSRLLFSPVKERRPLLTPSQPTTPLEERAGNGWHQRQTLFS